MEGKGSEGSEAKEDRTETRRVFERSCCRRTGEAGGKVLGGGSQFRICELETPARAVPGNMKKNNRIEHVVEQGRRIVCIEGISPGEFVHPSLL
jgi:hypothetical protein